MELQFRQAIPEDANVVVPLIYSSGPPVFDFLLVNDVQRSAQEFLHAAFRQGDGQFGFSNHTVATHHDQVVGAGACFSRDNSFAFMTAAVRQFLPFYGLFRSLRVMHRGRQLQQLYDLPHRKKSYIAHLAVAPDWQGKGIGQELIACFLQVSRESGKTHVTLDVSAENPRAETLYSRIGFHVVSEHSAQLPGIAGHRRMEIEL